MSALTPNTVTSTTTTQEKVFHQTDKSSLLILSSNSDLSPSVYWDTPAVVVDTPSYGGGFFTLEVPTISRNDSFVGILSDEEAAECLRSINLFRKSFNDDIIRRSQILFGE